MADSRLLSRAAADTTFQSRCWWYFYDLSIDVVNEDGSVYPPSEAAARQRFARMVIQGQYPSESLAYSVLQNATIAATVEADGGSAANVPEGDIAFQANAIYSTLAKAMIQ